MTPQAALDSRAVSCPKCGAGITSGAKFCGGCGAAVISTEPHAAAFCPECGAKNAGGGRSCRNCGKPLAAGLPGAAAPQPSGPPSPGVAAADSKKTAAGICGILLGGLGVHKFVLGYNGAGVIMLCVTLGCAVGGILTCGATWFVLPAMQVIGLVEGIIYLTKSDEDFVRTYVNGRKEWF